jgi:hypothetical protein
LLKVRQCLCARPTSVGSIGLARANGCFDCVSQLGVSERVLTTNYHILSVLSSSNCLSTRQGSSKKNTARAVLTAIGLINQTGTRSR